MLYLYLSSPHTVCTVYSDLVILKDSKTNCFAKACYKIAIKDFHQYEKIILYYIWVVLN